MEQAILPFLFYLVLQVPVLIVGASVVRTEAGTAGIIRTFVVGQMTAMALVEVLAVPMILLRCRFDVLFYAFLAVFLVLFVLGLRKLLKTRREYRTLERDTRKEKNLIAVAFLIPAILLILYQVLVYFFGMHLDEDDARWLAEANDALTYGDMMLRHFYTGKYVGRFVVGRDISSPWPMMFAILSRLLMNTRVTIVAHTVFAPFELLVMYGIYYLLGRELFQKKESRAAFLLAVAVINLFFAGARHTQSVFILNRIWQGKASVASVLIPFLLYLFVRINRKNETEDWLLLPVVSCAGCLMSGMGLAFSTVMIAVYGGYHIIAYKAWKRIPYYLVSLLPSAVMLVLYFFLEG